MLILLEAKSGVWVLAKNLHLVPQPDSERLSFVSSFGVCAMAAQKIAKYSLPGKYKCAFPMPMLMWTDLKNTTDDALPNYLTSLKFSQSHHLNDVRLSLGYSAVVIAAATFLADYKLGWDATKVGTFYAVLAYFVLNGALTLWIWGVERGVVFSGERDQSTV